MANSQREKIRKERAKAIRREKTIQRTVIAVAAVIVIAVQKVIV